MINGKFYTGLPSEMMTRSRVVNRQSTNFFWPDETDMVSVADKSKRTSAKASTPAPAATNFNNELTQSTDIKPKELFRKQLSSGIQFYDNVNAKTPEPRRRHFKKIDNVNLNNNNDGKYQPERKKLETFSSKIGFYDFEKEIDVPIGRTGKNERPVKPMKKENDINIDDVKPNSKYIQDVNKKRISFRTEEKTKGILKRGDDKSTTETVVVQPLPQRGLLPKNLSKSVENISKMAKSAVEHDLKTDKKPEKLSSIINEVKQLNLSQERKPSYDRCEKNESGNNHRRSAKDHYEDEPKWNKDYSPSGEYRDESDYYHFTESTYRNDGPKGHRNDYRYEDRRGRDRHYNDYDRNDRGQQQPRETYREQRYEERCGESPIGERYAPKHRDNFERDYGRQSPIQRKPYNSYYEQSPRSIRYDEEYPTTRSSSNRSPEHLPQHLRTNILSNGNVRPQSKRALSVRDSAVTRVGVGLPDYE